MTRLPFWGGWVGGWVGRVRGWVRPARGLCFECTTSFSFITIVSFKLYSTNKRRLLKLFSMNCEIPIHFNVLGTIMHDLSS